MLPVGLGFVTFSLAETPQSVKRELGSMGVAICWLLSEKLTSNRFRHHYLKG